MKIHHFGIQVEDIDKSINFYTHKLVFKIVTKKTTAEDKIYTYANLGFDGVEIELIQIHQEEKKMNLEY